MGMKLGKIAAVVTMIVSVLVPATATATATTAGTTSAACAPTQQAKWVGNYRGPHEDESTWNTGTTTIDVQLTVQNGQFRFVRYGLSQRAVINGGYARTSGGGNDWFYATSATCAGDGTVQTFSGRYAHQFDVFCFSCVVGGDFEVGRI